jgi:hypothetical protein
MESEETVARRLANSMTQSRRALCTLALACAVLLPSGLVLSAQRQPDEKPSLALRATPPVGFSPLRVRAVAELRGGSDHFEDFYCVTVEWEWGDGTTSEYSSDCDPYEAGQSTIERRFTAEHVYRQQGQHRIFFRLKQKTRQVGATSANIQVRGGPGDAFGR